jgi:5-methylcytosine-specific restriction endonuclease McrA
MELSLKRFIISTLRRATYRWPHRNTALVNARIARNQYKCANCEKIFTRKEIKIDHIEPIVPLSGFTTWDEYINRMFCGVEGLQILCSPCHNEKTWDENSGRTLSRKRKKVNIKRKVRKNDKRK